MRPVSQSQSSLQFGAAQLSGERNDQLLGLMWNSPDILFGIMIGILFGWLRARSLMYRKTNQEPDAVLVTLKGRGR